MSWMKPFFSKSVVKENAATLLAVKLKKCFLD